MGHPLGLCRNRGATLRVALSCPRTCVLGEGCGLPVRARLCHACRPEPRLPARRPGRAETRQHCRNRGSPHPGSGSSMAERACCPPHGGSRPQSDSCRNSRPLWVKNEPRPLPTPQPPRVAMATLLEGGGVGSSGRGVSRGRERSGHWWGVRRGALLKRLEAQRDWTDGRRAPAATTGPEPLWTRPAVGRWPPRPLGHQTWGAPGTREKKPRGRTGKGQGSREGLGPQGAPEGKELRAGGRRRLHGRLEARGKGSGERALAGR